MSTIRIGVSLDTLASQIAEARSKTEGKEVKPAEVRAELQPKFDRDGDGYVTNRPADPCALWKGSELNALLLAGVTKQIPGWEAVNDTVLHANLAQDVVVERAHMEGYPKTGEWRSAGDDYIASFKVPDSVPEPKNQQECAPDAPAVTVHFGKDPVPTLPLERDVSHFYHSGQWKDSGFRNDVETVKPLSELEFWTKFQELHDPLHKGFADAAGHGRPVEAHASGAVERNRRRVQILEQLQHQKPDLDQPLDAANRIVAVYDLARKGGLKLRALPDSTSSETKAKVAATLLEVAERFDSTYAAPFQWEAARLLGLKPNATPSELSAAVEKAGAKGVVLSVDELVKLSLVNNDPRLNKGQ